MQTRNLTSINEQATDILNQATETQNTGRSRIIRYQQPSPAQAEFLTAGAASSFRVFVPASGQEIVFTEQDLSTPETAAGVHDALIVQLAA